MVRDWSSVSVTFPYCLVRCVCHCHHFGHLAVVAPCAVASLPLSLSSTSVPRPLPRSAPCTPIPSASAFVLSLLSSAAYPAPLPAALSPASFSAAVNTPPVKSLRRHPHSFLFLPRYPRRPRGRGCCLHHRWCRRLLYSLPASLGAPFRCTSLVLSSVLPCWNFLPSP